ncbi:DNA cytosine methyltransferase [Nakamurella aerolata]|uniref:DNA (cytosine-5-)-methyltransferase n=1 Tax=Nakamurella aerolata TaxID=1656892 RepID=A0A849ABF2_9ACTN|nr:DNA cytosine methyltransferase [Nakamurella aerolata]NNG36916.1 DNA cytosine methyltransferase [Nakamurella aerolata]
MLTLGSLFTGAGGLDIAVEDVFGARTVWRSDIKPASVRLIDHYWPGSNIGDITEADWSQVPPVDVISGGSPCQDMSAAGRRAGMTTGSRSGLWAHMRQAIEAIRPRYVVWENVEGAYSACAETDSDDHLGPCPRCVEMDNRRLRHAPNVRAVGRVLGDLANLGFDAEWINVRASDVGAPHRRGRVFTLAWRADAHPVGGGWDGGAHVPVGQPVGGAAATGGGAETRGGLTLLPTPTVVQRPNKSASPGAALRLPLEGVVQLLPTPRVSDSTGPGVHGNGGLDLRTAVIEHLLPTPRHSDGPHGTVSDTPAARRHVAEGRGTLPEVAATTQDWQKYERAIRHWEARTRPAPAPTITGPKGGQRISPDFVDWMMGWPAGWTAVPGVSRPQRLSLGGDGVVPQQAAAALRIMLARATGEAVA